MKNEKVKNEKENDKRFEPGLCVKGRFSMSGIKSEFTKVVSNGRMDMFSNFFRTLIVTINTKLQIM